MNKGGELSVIFPSYAHFWGYIKNIRFSPENPILNLNPKRYKEIV